MRLKFWVKSPFGILRDEYYYTTVGLAGVCFIDDLFFVSTLEKEKYF